MSASRPSPTIALVAVPGERGGAPGASARSLADLLLRLRARRTSRYTSFIERAVRIPTRQARVNPRSAPNVAPDLGSSIFAEQHDFLRTQLRYGGAAARDREEDSPDHQLMRAQLAEYDGTGVAYDTIRLEGERLADAADGGTAEVQARLHVYELRTTDLAGARRATARFVADVYGIFFQVVQLGRIALDHARLEHSTSRLWRAYGTSYTWAARVLTVLLPALFASMLVALVSASVLALPDTAKVYVAAAGMILLGSALVAASSYQTWTRRLVALWLPIPLALALAAFGLSARVHRPVLDAVRGAAADTLLVDRLVLGAWLLAAAVIVYVVFRAHERLRPGALVAGLGAYLFAATPLVFLAATARGVGDLTDGTLHVFEAAAALAATAWDAVFLLGALAGCLGLVACVRSQGAARDRARRTTRTAVAALGAGTTLLFVGTFFAWSIVFRIVAATLPARPFSAMIPAFRSPDQAYAGFFERVIDVSAGAGSTLLIVCAAAVVALAVVTLGRVLVEETGEPRLADESREAAFDAATARGALDTDVLWAFWERFRRTGDTSQRLGDWLSGGFRAVTLLAGALYVVAFFLAPLISGVHAVTGAPALTPLAEMADSVVLVVGGCVVAVVVATVGLRGRLAPLTLGFGSLVEAVLQVERYLRTRPRTSTPRARAAERYVSLLRYLCHWRDHTGRPYDAIVLVAQAQGAALTADLLNFVQREEDAELDPIRRPLTNGVPGAAGRRLFLLTAGNPLRQIYSEWFPHLFGWVRGDSGDGVSRRLPAVPREPWMLLPRLEEGHRVFAPAIPDAAAPDPYAMGVTRWVNAYRSGDYVGRALWRQSIDAADWIHRPAPSDAATRFVGDVPPVIYVSEDAHRSRRELCIGAGGHTHYLDGTANAIAVELDLLVVDACRLATRVAKDTGAPAEGMES